jgi:gamma-glutamylcyclotransferase (GGCT)/AIG2-like uncharacterized protein YtfP
MNIFTYGSLMYDRVWSRVVSQTYRKKLGVVQSFQRLKVANEQYPGLIKGDGEVEGVVYFDISAQDLARLDNFEGKLYQREEVKVMCADGTEVVAFVYVIRDEFKEVLGGEWPKEEFEHKGLAEFEARYVGFDSV